MELLIDCRSEIILPAHFKDIIKKAASQTLKRTESSDDFEISVSIVDDQEIRDINRRFRRIDKETDVLSFPFMDVTDRFLGDIIISASKVFSQAEQYGHSPEREIGFLTTHGILHLLGYDHMTDNDEHKMNALQEQVMQDLGLDI